MADIFDIEKRSAIMRRIKGKDTKPEMMVRRYLHSLGFRYRLHVKNLPGKPDMVLTKYKTVIFVHGCFWHGHLGCSKAGLPKTRTDWWKQKILKNTFNDLKNQKELREAGWKVILVWQCELKPSAIQNTFQHLVQQIEL